MSKGKRYKKRAKKRYINFFLFYIIVAMITFIGYTFSGYTQVVDSEGSPILVAQFNVKVNDIVVGEGNKFELQLSPSKNTLVNKISPDHEGYFEIVIDPTGTEVSLEYEFKFHLENLYKDIHLTTFTVNDGDPIKITDNDVKGDILLPNSETGFSESEKTTIKVNWEWNGEDIVNPEITDKDISVISTIRQKIN